MTSWRSSFRKTVAVSWGLRRPKLCVRRSIGSLRPKTCRKSSVSSRLCAGSAKQFDLLFGRRAAAQSFGAPWENMPKIAPIGVRIGKYMEVPEQGPRLHVCVMSGLANPSVHLRHFSFDPVNRSDAQADLLGHLHDARPLT